MDDKGISPTAVGEEGCRPPLRELFEKSSTKTFTSALRADNTIGVSAKNFAMLPRELGAGIARRHVAAGLPPAASHEQEAPVQRNRCTGVIFILPYKSPRVGTRLGRKPA